MRTVCFDVNNLAIRNLFGPDVLVMNPNDKTNVIETNYDIMKYRMFDAIYKSLFRIGDVREVVLAMDSRRSWRKLYWTKYKAHRKSAREKIDLNWDDFFAMYDEFMLDIQNNMPFKVMKIDDVEADDIIGVLALEKPQDFYIISTDKDFLQLCSPRVKIYNPLKKVHVEHPNPELFIVEQSLCGQAKDNIFNVKTPLDWPDGKRKPGFGTRAYEKVIATGLDKWLDENNLRDRYNFNRNLMDFAKIPPEIKRRIHRDYDNYTKPSPDNIYEFIKKYGWPEYLDNFTYVENRLLELY